MFKGGTLQEGEIILGDTSPGTADRCKDGILPLPLGVDARIAWEPNMLMNPKFSALLKNTYLLQGKRLGVNQTVQGGFGYQNS